MKAGSKWRERQTRSESERKCGRRSIAGRTSAWIESSWCASESRIEVSGTRSSSILERSACERGAVSIPAKRARTGGTHEQLSERSLKQRSTSVAAEAPQLDLLDRAPGVLVPPPLARVRRGRLGELAPDDEPLQVRGPPDEPAQLVPSDGERESLHLGPEADLVAELVLIVKDGQIGRASCRERVS